MKKFGKIAFIITFLLFTILFILSEIQTRKQTYKVKSSIEKRIQELSTPKSSRSNFSTPTITKSPLPQRKSSLQYSELSYEKRKEIYIDFAEDPSFDSLTPYSEKMYDYRMKKYTNRYNISKNAMARIMLEGIQKGW